MTISAYDMNFSGDINGPASVRRYISRPRSEPIFGKEFDLVLLRIQAHSSGNSTFFTYGDTLTAPGSRDDLLMASGLSRAAWPVPFFLILAGKS